MAAHTLTPMETKKSILQIMSAKLPIMLWGGPGIGKSQIIRQIAEELEIDFIDVRLSQMEPTDLRGIPIPFTNENGVKEVVWAVPAMWPKDENWAGIIFFDELNAAMPVIQAAAYQIVLDRKLGEYVVPKNAHVMAAGNRDTDRAVTFKMPSPLLNRFVHLEMRPDFEDWYDWAMSNKVNPDVVAYVSYAKKHLYMFNPADPNLQAFATPRTWVYLSDILNAGTSHISNDILKAIISGCVGETVANDMMTFIKYAKKLPDPYLILDGKFNKKLDLSEAGMNYSLITHLLFAIEDQANKMINKEIKEDVFYGQLNNFLKFMQDYYEGNSEFQALAVKRTVSAKNYKMCVSKCPNFDFFMKKYKDVIAGA